MKAERTDSEPRVAQLEAANARLQAANARLQAENAQLRAENAQLRAAETRWQAQQEELRRQLQAWQEQVQELQRRLGLDSSATDAQPASSVWQAVWGQPGHTGTTLSQTDTPDQIQAHWPSDCSRCCQSGSKPRSQTAFVSTVPPAPSGRPCVAPTHCQPAAL